MPSSEIYHRMPEDVTPKEILGPSFDVINLCAKAGAGSSTLGENLKTRFESEGYEVLLLHGGSGLRRESIEKTGEDFTGFYERPIEKDKEIETLTARLLVENQHPGMIVILDSRLGAWVSRKLQDANVQMSAKVQNILLTARADIRYGRVYQREIKKGKKTTYRTVVNDTRSRDTEDMKNFQTAYPELKGIDVLSRRNKDENGNPLYQRVINTSHKTEAQITEEAYNFITKQGLVAKKGERKPQMAF